MLGHFSKVMPGLAWLGQIRQFYDSLGQVSPG